MEPVDAVARLGGAASWRHVVALGVTDGRLRAATRSGLLLRPAPGVYALPDVAADVVTAVCLRGRLTCSSAAPHLGLDVLHRPSLPHVTVPRHRSCRSADAVVHRADVPGRGAIVPVTYALLSALRCLPLVESVVLVDSALRAGAVTADSLEQRLQGPGSVRARRALGAADGRSGSVIETVVRLALLRAGLPVVPQVWVGGVGRVDLLVGGWLVVEVDGFAYHSERAQYREDRRRGNALAARGYRLLRLSYEDVLGDLPRAVDLVRQVFVAGR